jgi:hypothetical protein
MKDTVPGDRTIPTPTFWQIALLQSRLISRAKWPRFIQRQVNPGRLAAVPRGCLTAISQMNSASLKAQR